MSWMTKLSALEIMAFTMMEEEVRIIRLAHLCRTQGNIWARPTSIAVAKDVLARIGEPHGKKGRLAIALRDEYFRQVGVSRQRKSLRRPSFNGSIGKNWRGDVRHYDPVSYKQYSRGLTKRDRVKAICLVRLADYTEGEEDLLPNVYWWTGTVVNWDVYHAEIRDKSYFIQVKPTTSWRNRHNGAKTRQWLVYKTKDGVAGAVRIPRKTRGSIDEAIETLKSSIVKKAEKAGASIEIDWANKAFIVRSARRKKARSIPFKSHVRKKKVKE